MTPAERAARTRREPLPSGLPEGWSDEIVVHSLRRNRDGSVTVEAVVNVYDPEGGRVYSADRRFRLQGGSW